MNARDWQVARETVRPRSECPHCNPPGPALLNPDLFPGDYKARMIAAYPMIAGLSRDEAWTATPQQREAAFMRVLAAKNLRRTHELFLHDQGATP